jgi:hypothetical protein
MQRLVLGLRLQEVRAKLPGVVRQLSPFDAGTRAGARRLHLSRYVSRYVSRYRYGIGYGKGLLVLLMAQEGTLRDTMHVCNATIGQTVYKRLVDRATRVMGTDATRPRHGTPRCWMSTFVNIASAHMLANTSLLHDKF